MVANAELTIDDITQAGDDPFATLNGLLNDYNAAQGASAKHLPLWLFADRKSVV